MPASTGSDRPSPAATHRVACIGECMLEICEQAGELRRGFGGDTANLAVYLKRLLPELPVRYVTAIGNDELSDELREWLVSEGLETDALRRIGGRLPGLYWIRTARDGERRFHYWRGESAARCLLDGGHATALERSLAGTTLACFSGITLAILSGEARETLLEMLARLRERGCRVAFDSNYRPALWPDVHLARREFARALAITDIAMLGEADCHALYRDTEPGAMLERAAAAGAAEVILRCGSAGCEGLSGARRWSVPVPKPVAAVDTTAAGDAFAAAWLAARLMDLDPETAALAGHRLAATVVAHPGAIIPRSAMPAAAALFGDR